MNRLIDYINYFLDISLLHLIEMVPLLLGLVIILILGVILSRWSHWVVVKLGRGILKSSWYKNSPLEYFIKRLGNQDLPIILAAETARWLVLIVFMLIAANYLSLDFISQILIEILAFFPKVIAAIIILVIGIIAAGLLESVIKSGFKGFGAASAKLISRVTSYVVLIFTVLAALAQLGIAENLIYIIFVGMVAGFSLAFGLAVGLGARDTVSKMLADWYQNIKSD